jgi:hypothetical protein
MLASCGVEREPKTPFGDADAGTGTLPPDREPTATSGIDGESDSSVSGTTTAEDPEDDGLKLDVGPPGGTGADPREGCGKIDFLFVVDNSGSMSVQQETLIASFPGFISEIVETTGAEDFHVMVVTSSWRKFVVGRCANRCQNKDEEHCFWDASIACADESFIDPGFWSCDDSLGVGVTTDLHGSDCSLVGGHRYLTDQQPNLEEAFGCIARVGDDGSPYEYMLDAQIFATSKAFNDPGGCHPGFLRDDAVLVVTFITDEYGNDWAEGEAVYESLVEAKHGDPEAIVMLGLFGDTHLANGVCTHTDQNMPGGAHHSPHFESFVGMFGDRGQWASVCEDDYTPFFASAVSIVDEACEEFVPAG